MSLHEWTWSLTAVALLGLASGCKEVSHASHA